MEDTYQDFYSQVEPSGEFQEPQLTPPPPRYPEDPEVGIIKELSPKKIIEQVRMELRGYFYDYEDKKWVRVTGIDPLMNDEGISIFLHVLSSVVSDLVTFSNFNEEEVNKITEYICCETLPVIHINYKKYGIKEKSHLNVINAKIFSLTLAALKKAMFAGDRGVIKKGYHEDISRSYAPYGQLRPEQKRGFMGRINPFT